MAAMAILWVWSSGKQAGMVADTMPAAFCPTCPHSHANPPPSAVAAAVGIAPDSMEMHLLRMGKGLTPAVKQKHAKLAAALALCELMGEAGAGEVVRRYGSEGFLSPQRRQRRPAAEAAGRRGQVDGECAAMFCVVRKLGLPSVGREGGLARVWQQPRSARLMCSQLITCLPLGVQAMAAMLCDSAGWWPLGEHDPALAPSHAP